MNKDYVKGLKQGLGFLTILGLAFGLVYAVGFHNPNEILGGMFIGNYSFNGTVNLSSAEVVGNSKISFVDTLGSVDSYTKLLIHSRTTNGSTTFTDSSSSGHTLIANGGITHENFTSKFNSSSINFDTNDYLTVADSSDFTLGTNDFTIDFWVYIIDNSDTGQGFISHAQDSSSSGWTFVWNGPDGINFFINGNNIVFPSTLSRNLTQDEWSHLAISRLGNDWYLFKNGVIQSSVIDSTSVSDYSGTLKIGRGSSFSGGLFAGSSGYYLEDGYMDEIRISNGIARWTSNFIPPTSPYGITQLAKLEDKNGNQYNLTLS